MVGKRASNCSRPVASSQTWSVPSAISLAVMARATTSRGRSSSTKRSLDWSRMSAPWPRSASDRSGLGMRGLNSAVGWNCMNSTSAHGTPARSAMARPSPVDSNGLVVAAKSWPVPPVASSTWRARISRLPSGPRATTPRQRPSRTIRSRANHSSHTAAAVSRTAVDEGPFDLGPGRRRPRRGRCGAASGRPRGPGAARRLAVAVEDGAHGDELVDAPRALVDQHADGVDIAQAGAGGQGVGQMEVGRVGVAAEHGGHAALGPSGGGLRHLRLGQDAHAQCHLVGRPHRRRQAGHAAAHDEQVELVGSKPRHRGEI